MDKTVPTHNPVGNKRLLRICLAAPALGSANSQTMGVQPILLTYKNPCTLSQHPDTRETGYSNVLANSQTMEPISWPIKTSLLHHPARTQSDIGNIHKTNYQTWQKHDCTVLVCFILEGVFNMHIATLLTLCAMCRCAQCQDIYSDKILAELCGQG